jgi:para-aminobenzoate synthetase/4-amino-4-deoxychorismate lyase
MQIIHELEAEARGLYTGSIGIIAPHRKAQFNVAIRTVVVDKINHRADFGVGSGIVWDSVAADEFDECRAKASVLTAKLSQYA